MTKNGLEGKRLADKSDKAEKAARGNGIRGKAEGGIGKRYRHAAHISASRGCGHGDGTDAASSENVVERHRFASGLKNSYHLFLLSRFLKKILIL